jgi:hypothetical protein
VVVESALGWTARPRAPGRPPPTRALGLPAGPRRPRQALHSTRPRGVGARPRVLGNEEGIAPNGTPLRRALLEREPAATPHTFDRPVPGILSARLRLAGAASGWGRGLRVPTAAPPMQQGARGDSEDAVLHRRRMRPLRGSWEVGVQAARRRGRVAFSTRRLGHGLAKLTVGEGRQAPAPPVGGASQKPPWSRTRPTSVGGRPTSHPRVQERPDAVGAPVPRAGQ